MAEVGADRFDIDGSFRLGSALGSRTGKRIDALSTAAHPPSFRGSDSAPFVYFDVAPTYGVFSGAVEIEVAARMLLPEGADTKVEFVTTGHLRCSPAAAANLRDALNAALKMLENVQGAPPSATGRLN
jgi:hypothetical protein